MQDLRTGDMHEIPEQLTAKLRQGDIGKRRELVQEAMKKKGIPAEHQGPVIEVGTVIKILGGSFEVRGLERKKITLQLMKDQKIDKEIEPGGVISIGKGAFKVMSFGNRFMILRGMPGTHIMDK